MGPGAAKWDQELPHGPGATMWGQEPPCWARSHHMGQAFHTQLAFPDVPASSRWGCSIHITRWGYLMAPQRRVATLPPWLRWRLLAFSTARHGALEQISAQLALERAGTNHTQLVMTENPN